MSNNSHTPIVLILGASSGIAQATAMQCAGEGKEVWRVSRNSTKLEPIAGAVDLESDYSDDSINEISERLSPFVDRLQWVVSCNGVLHNELLFPEKQLRELTAEKFNQSMQVNALLPMRWLQALALKIPSQQPVVLTFLSARVGSIKDNGLGGWYSYRASKAALNMLVKTASLELKRTHPKAACILFHPGTTDTQLSKPFQQRVAKGKLFTPAFVAEVLIKNSFEQAEAGNVKFVDWAGEAIDF